MRDFGRQVFEGRIGVSRGGRFFEDFERVGGMRRKSFGR